MRSVELFPVGTQAPQSFALTDPLRVASQRVVISPGALAVLRLADGSRTLREIQADIVRATGHILPFEQIENLLGTLNEQLYLDSPRFHEAYRAMREEYLARPSRPATLAGAAYPAEPTELRRFLDGLFAGPHEPERPEPNLARRKVKALVAPHIDLRRGRSAFARAYAELATASDADVFVILGIAHSGDGKPYTLTDKDFETPLGTVPTEKEMVARLRDLALPEALGDEFAHRNEHSIEFQAVLLRYLYPDRNITIVPILCGGLHEALVENRRPIEQPEIAGFIEALRRVITESGKRVCIIAAVDLAHVGGRFGDTVTVDGRFLRWVEREDRAMLDAVAALDSGAFFQSLQKDRNRRNVCGYPALYTMLSLFEQDGVSKPTSGRLLCYEQSPEEETGSAVTFAAMAFR